MLHFNVTLLDYHFFRYSSVKNPKSFPRLGRLSTKSLTNLTGGSLSTRILFEFKIPNALDLRCNIVERSQVFIFLVIGNDLSGVADVAPFTNMIFTMVMTFFWHSFAWQNFCISSKTLHEQDFLHHRNELIIKKTHFL